MTAVRDFESWLAAAGSRATLRLMEPEAILEAGSNVMRLRLVDGVYRRLRREGEDVTAQMREDVAAASAMLDRAMADVGADLLQAAEGADGVAYVLEGAHPEACSPMQYGGLYLERDRDLLATAVDKGPVALIVLGGEGVYLDFVSDLPAGLFVWDARASGIDVDTMRAMRSGLLAAQALGADVDVTGEGGFENL